MKNSANLPQPPHGKGAVLDGRDIGSVVLPDADAKFFVDAAADIRATRRYLELKARGEILNFQKYYRILFNVTAVIKIAQLRL